MAPHHLRSFEALEMTVRKGSFASAALELGISAAAVGQRVKALEDYLGFPLLVRGQRGVEVTSELLQVLPHLRRAFAELTTASQMIGLRANPP